MLPFHKIIGFFVVMGMTFGGFFVAGGTMHVIDIMLKALPGESMIIIGSAIGAFMIANTNHTIGMTLKYFKSLVEPEAYTKDDYMELLTMMFAIFKLARSKGWLALEQHIENPDESELFSNFPKFKGNHHALIFLCDYLRIISLGNENAMELETLMDQEIETIEASEGHAGHAIQTMADGIPALGIVAAVLGVIKTMASISEPPEVLGGLIGKALVGTFLGVFVAYGFVAPIANAMNDRAASEVLYYKALKSGILAFLNGSAPQVAIEFPRKFLPHDLQPTFLEVEEAVNELPNFAS